MMFPHARAPRRVALAACLLLGMAARVLPAHELEESAVTLVIREGGALELRVVCTWSRLLVEPLPAAALTADGRRAQLLRLTAEPTAQFAARYDRLRRVLERGTVAWYSDGSRHGFGAWQWPSATQVQEALRQELMAETTSGARDHHASRLMATARLVAGPLAESVRVDLPKALGAVLFTSIRPEVQWLGAGAPSPTVRLRRP